MKIKLLKDHHAYGNAGDEVDVLDERANYLIRIGIAEESKEKDEIEPAKEKKEIKPEREKKTHTGLPTAIKKRGRKPKQS